MGIIAGTMVVLAETNTPAAKPVTAKKPISFAASTNEPTVVTSDRLQVDYAHNVGTFEGNVLAVDPRLTVRADKMIVLFGTSTNSTRTLQTITADGGVIINQGDKKSTSDHAVYTADDGKVVLTGNPQLQNPNGTINGHRITMWRDSERMEVESENTETNRTRLVIFPEDKKEKDKVKEKTE
jgi:lipopolysaccharide transport protein LptA